MSKTLFEKIIAREIAAQILYEDDLVLAFRDIAPQAPTHILIIPKKPIPRLAEATPADQQTLGHPLVESCRGRGKAWAQTIRLSARVQQWTGRG